MEQSEEYICQVIPAKNSIIIKKFVIKFKRVYWLT